MPCPETLPSVLSSSTQAAVVPTTRRTAVVWVTCSAQPDPIDRRRSLALART